jgi:hypothetical protein
VSAAHYDDCTLAVIGLLTLGSATVSELQARLRYNPDRVVGALSRLIEDERAVLLLNSERYALVTT